MSHHLLNSDGMTFDRGVESQGPETAPGSLQHELEPAVISRELLGVHRYLHHAAGPRQNEGTHDTLHHCSL